ncbi:MAG: PAS domain-containing protein [Chloroflexi bacterium]|nr:PAS domain-containing protein [Chloroflexota bacterium]
MTSQALQAQLDQYAEQQQLLLNVTRQIAESPALDELIPDMLEGVVRATHADGVRLLIGGGGQRWQVYGAGPQAETMASADGVIGQLVAEHGEIESGRAGEEASNGSLDLPPGLAALAAVPLIAHQAQYGVLWLGFCEPHVSGEAERTFLSIVAGQAAIAVANAQSFEAARRRREWLAAILASTPDPVLVVNRNQALELINPAAQDLFGISGRESLGQPLAQVVQMPELLALFEQYRDTGRAAVSEIAGPNERIYLPSVSDVRTEDGEMTGWVLVLRDISHFKRLNEGMSNFLSTVSHDMRSPLTFMKGYLDMLGMVGTLNERQSDFVEKIGTGVIQMSDMVEKVLEAGRLDPVTGNYELAREPVDVAEIVQKVVTGLVEPAAKKNLDFSATLHQNLPVLNLDRAMITSAFTNLVENAVKYTPDGGWVHVEAGIQDGELIFKVEDNGYGISPVDQARLFQRNVRVRRKEWKRVKGSGLGLFIVRNIAQRHGGDAWVESTEGEGSTFYLVIPLDGPNLVTGGTSGGATD